MFFFQLHPGNLLNTPHWPAIDAGDVVAWRGGYTVDCLDGTAIRRLARQELDTMVAEEIRLMDSV